MNSINDNYNCHNYFYCDCIIIFYLFLTDMILLNSKELISIPIDNLLFMILCQTNIISLMILVALRGFFQRVDFDPSREHHHRGHVLWKYIACLAAHLHRINFDLHQRPHYYGLAPD